MSGAILGRSARTEKESDKIACDFAVMLEQHQQHDAEALVN